MNRRGAVSTLRMICLATVAGVCVAASAQPAAGQARPAGRNLALGKPYRFSKLPVYTRCSGPGDAIDLTDGKIVKGEGSAGGQPFLDMPRGLR